MIHLIMFFALAFCTQAKDLRFGSKTLNVAIRWEMIDPMNPSQGLKPTYLRFTKPVYRFDNITLFSLEAVKSKNGSSDFREFKVLPRKSTGNQVVEIQLQDRTLVSVYFYISKEDSIPLSYDFKPEKIPDLNEGNEKVYTDVVVMKSVLLGHNLYGFEKKNESIKLNCENRNLRAETVRILEGHGFKVVQVKVSNLSKKEVFEFLPENVGFEKRDFSKSELKHFEKEQLFSEKSTIVTFIVDQVASVNSLKICKIGLQLKKFKKNLKGIFYE